MDSLAPPETLSPDPLITENSDLCSETLTQTEGIAEANTPLAAGEFVWAKVAGNPWWPALVSSQMKQDSVLVACFGDEDTLAWCEPNQLKPFLEVFDEMSRQSRSKSFLSALHSCVEEIGRNLELELTCHCVPVEARSNPLRGEASRELAVANFSSMEFQESVLDAARNVSVVNSLDAVRLRSWVFAFGKVSMQEESWVFHRRRGIEDLVDKIDLDALPVEIVNGKEEEEAVVDTSVGKRRRKSMSKLIADMDLDTLEIGDDEEKEEQSSRSKRYRSKGTAEVVKVEEEHGSSSGRRERKKSKYLSPPYTNLREVGKFLAMLPRKGCSFSDHGAAVSSAYNGEEDENTSNLQKIEKMPESELYSEFLSTAENPLHLKGNRIAKVVKYFFGIYRESKYSDGADFEDYRKLVHESIANTEDTNVEDSLKLEHNARSSRGGAYTETDLLDAEQKNADSNPGADQEKNLNFEHLKKNRNHGDLLNIKRQKFSGSLEKQKPRRKKLPIYMDFCNANALDAARNELPMSRNNMDETIEGPQFDSDINPENASSFHVKEKQKPRRKKKMNDATGKRIPSNLDLNMADSSGVFKFRQGNKRSKKDANGESSVDLQSVDGLNKDVVLAIEPLNCQEQVVLSDKNVGDANGKTLQKSCYADARFAELAKSVLKKKNSSGPPKARLGKKKVKGVNPAYSRHAALHLTFHSGVDLPCVEDLVTTYSKYGALIPNRIELLEESNSARVVFVNAADAENAFKDKAGPYGSVATYRLHYLSENLVNPSESNHDPSLQIYDVTPSHQPDLKSPVHKPPLPYIRKSLATMISTLALSSSSSSPNNNAGLTSDGLKPEARENLVDEMQGLLQKVDKMLNGTGPSTST